MTEEFLTGQIRLQRPHAGPLGAYISTFARLLSERGYAPYSAEYRIRLVARLGHWLHRRRLGVKDLDEQRIAQFLQYRRRTVRIRPGDLTALRELLKQLREVGVVPSPPRKIDDSDRGRIAREFSDYLTKERRLSEATLANYLPVARRFLAERFGGGPIRLRNLRSPDAARFILRHVRTVSRGHVAKVMVTALRSFFRFLRLRGDISTDLAAAVPTVANWRFATLPKWIPQEQVELLLKSCDQSTATGRRDYAILLLLARLGLRSGDVVAMSLDDIDWEAGEIKVGGKSRRKDRLPLPKDVGEALVKYLRHGRPRCSTRQVFVRMRSPLRGFLGSSAVYSLVKRAFERAGLRPAQRGPHLLRHSLATNMLRKGASLAEIAEILRHQDRNTAQIYAKVDLTALRKLAQPWPGGEL